MNHNLKFIDLFAGIGGFRTALDNQGFDCVFSSEINQACKEVYKTNYGEEPFGDIAEIEPSSIPDHDILTAGFPCQPFSICGKRKGFDDTRGTLFFYIKEIIKEKQPKAIFLENVKHLVHHDKGNTLSTILDTLGSLGYFVKYKVLNSANFGLPQNRERLIIIATKDKPFDFSKLNYQNTHIQLKEMLDSEGDFEFLNESEYTMIENPKKQDSGLIFVGYRNKGIWKKGIRPNTEHLSRVHRQPNRIYSDLGTHPTIPSQETLGRFFIHLSDSNKVRKLTLDECYRIMGFSSNFVKHNSKAECYKQIGNSVCIPMINNIAESILKNHLL
jgi:DNA (cytosine-5)-methyltransferase 1